MVANARLSSQKPTFTPLLAGFLFAWTIAVGASLAWNIYQSHAQAHTLALHEALAIFHKDQGFRLWGTRHGGVYVPISEDTPPSPYMAHIPERDISTPSGRELTLLNPAYMVRQLMEDYSKLYGIRGHITGLTLLRPQNAPDQWEKSALHTLKDNPDLEEISAATTIDGLPYMRLIRPMYMKPGCEKCHGHLGFKDGDFRGGVSVAVPLAPYLKQRDTQNLVLGASHGAIWLLGLFSVIGGGRKIHRSFADTQRAEEEVRALNRELENRVEERTRELSDKTQRLDSTISNAADAIIVINQDGIIDTFNAAAAAMFEYSPEDCLGNPITMLMPEPHASMHPGYIQGYFQTGRSHIIGTGREVEARRKDGSIFPMYIAVSKLDLGDQILFSGICRDLTQDKMVERELLSAKRQAERANRAKSEFLASMSHELRTPLNGIIGFSQLLQFDPSEPLSARQTDYTNMINDAGQHLLSLINDILDLSRIETEGFSLSIETIDPVSAIQNCLTLIVPVMEKYHVEVDGTDVKGPIPLILADEVRFKQVLMNLLSNAAKYNKPGGVVILKAEEHDDKVRFSVIDNGPGIAPEKLDDLFEPFNRLGQEAGSIEGSGIGLTITRKLLHRMNGEIGVKSTVGQGSTFWFEVPISHNGAQKHAEIINDADGDIAPPEGHFRILYVEDNAHNRTLMQELLKPFNNLEYITAVRGEDGVVLAADMHPDLILMDIDLPGIDGFETLLRLKERERTQDIPVIAISANALPRDIRKGGRAAFVDYLTKPIDVRRTQQVIFKALEKHAKGKNAQD